jgi:P27 family predicted phage terminase small subunit
MSRRPKPKTGATSSGGRSVPTAPDTLGPEGLKAWEWVWSEDHTWINDRHLQLITRYCRIQDVLDQAFRQIKQDGLMVPGSKGQLRCNPVTVELRSLSTESRLCEIELGLTPCAESKAGAAPKVPTSAKEPANPAEARRDGPSSMLTLLSDHRERGAGA